jgi:hypothetical protein
MKTGNANDQIILIVLEYLDLVLCSEKAVLVDLD